MSTNSNLNQVGAVLQSVPLDYLIATPLMCACDAQVSLATAAVNFIDTVAFDQDGNTRIITMQSSIIDTAGNTTIKSMNVPLLTLVNSPYLYIQKVDVDLVVEVDDAQKTSNTSSSNTNTDLDVSANAKYGFGAFSASLSADYKVSSKLSSSSSNSDSLNTNAKYVLHIEATNEQPVGMTKILNFLTN